MESLVSEKIRESYLLEKSDDQLGFYKLSQNILNYLLDKKFPITLGIYGKWGSGKSVVANFMKKSCVDDKIRFIHFDAIAYKESSTSILSHLIAEIIKAVGPEHFKGILGFGYSGSIKILGTLAKNYIPNLDEILGMGMEKLIGLLGTKISKKWPQHKFIVIIDNLDRLTPKDTLAFLEQLKTFLLFDGIKTLSQLSYVILCDFDILEKEVKEIYGHKLDVRDYLNKLIEIPFYLPSYDSNIGTGLVKSLLNKEIPNEMQESICKILIAANLNTPRDLKNFLQELDIIFVIAKSRGHDEEFLVRNLDKILVIQILRVKFNAVLQYLKKCTFLKSNPNNEAGFFTDFYQYIYPQNRKIHKVPELYEITKADTLNTDLWIKSWDFLRSGGIVQNSTTVDLYCVTSELERLMAIVDSATTNITVKNIESIRIK